MASSEYTRYPGARKSIVNRTKNVEHLFIVHAGRSHAVPANVPAQMLVEKVRLLLRRTFLPEHDAAVFHSSGTTIRIKLSHRLFASDTDSVIAALTDADSGIIHDFISFLKERTAANGHQEIMCYLKVLSGHEIHGDYADILARIPKLYARFSSERDAADFVSITQEICTFLSERLARKDVAAMAIADECIALANKKITDSYISGAQASFVQHLIAGIEAAMRNLTV